MTELKREYVVPLRRKTKLAPKWRRSKKAVSVLKDFIEKHMKTDNVIICRELNEKIWENGIKNPPGKVSVVALKTQINGVEKTLVNLAEAGINTQMAQYAVEAPKTEKKTKPEQIKEAQVKEIKAKEEKSEKKAETKKEKEVVENE